MYPYSEAVSHVFLEGVPRTVTRGVNIFCIESPTALLAEPPNLICTRDQVFFYSLHIFYYEYQKRMGGFFFYPQTGGSVLVHACAVGIYAL